MADNHITSIDDLLDVVLPKDTYLFRIRTNIRDPSKSNDHAVFRFFIYLQNGKVEDWCNANIINLWKNKAMINNSSIELYRTHEDIKLYKLSINSYTYAEPTSHDKNSINRFLNFVNLNLRNPNYYEKVKTKLLSNNMLILDPTIRGNYNKIANNKNLLIAALNYCLLTVYAAEELDKYRHIVDNYENHKIKHLIQNPDLFLAGFFDACDINGWIRIGEIGNLNDGDEVMLVNKIMNNNMLITKLAEVTKTSESAFADICNKVLNLLEQDETEMSNNWNKRYRDNLDKMKTGNVYEVADVVRNLSFKQKEKGSLSTGEKKMLNNAKLILVS